MNLDNTPSLEGLLGEASHVCPSSQPEGCRVQDGSRSAQPHCAPTIKCIYIAGLVQKRQRAVWDIFLPSREGGRLLLTPYC